MSLIPFLLALIVPAGATPTPPDPQARAVASQVMEALGGEAAWRKIRFLRFDFAVETAGKIAMSRSHYWDKWTGRHRVEGQLAVDADAECGNLHLARALHRFCRRLPHRFGRDARLRAEPHE